MQVVRNDQKKEMNSRWPFRDGNISVPFVPSLHTIPLCTRKGTFYYQKTGGPTVVLMTHKGEETVKYNGCLP